jgi:hypothetical protein
MTQLRVCAIGLPLDQCVITWEESAKWRTSRQQRACKKTIAVEEQCGGTQVGAQLDGPRWRQDRPYEGPFKAFVECTGRKRDSKHGWDILDGG